MQVEEKFSYSAQPHAAPVGMKKSKYRENNLEQIQDEGSQNLGNIMFDPRVVRGSTYAAKVITNTERIAEARKMSRKVNPKFKSAPGRVGTPPPIDGRVHMKMQTEDFLEEITDKPIELDAETQTQQIMDRPPSPLFIRTKIGVDITTQIEDGDLFDFDLEVEPILEVLVGKTIHLSMLELMQAFSFFLLIEIFLFNLGGRA
jgi:hypothetical protein